MQFSSQKKTSPVKIDSQNGGFSEINSQNIKYSHRDPPPQRHFFHRNNVFWRILRKNPFKGVGCSELQEPKN